MFKKLIRYYHTLKHLKPIQIRYQIWYRFRNRFFPVRYPTELKAPPFRKVVLNPFPTQYEHYLGKNHFSFLNQEQRFNESIDWNCPANGKLWTYHLNYFDYLHQPGMTHDTGHELINYFLSDIQMRKDGMEPYPISLRTINWIKFMAVHQHYPQEMVDSLYAQYQVLTKKLEYHLLGNHLLENGFSLLFGALFFQDQKLTHLAKKILTKELNEQILSDGAHFELSPMYHTILLQRALDGYNLLINNSHQLHDLRSLLETTIRVMVNWLSVMLFRNGDLPLLNDSTEGQALDPTVILAYAGQLGFTPEPIALNESGYRKFESGEFELLTDVGPIAPDYQPGHAHCDLLSFILYHQNRPILVDRGISTYEKNVLREEQRGTASHNTVRINGLEQSDLWGGFRAGRRASPIILKDRTDQLRASHTGFDLAGCRHIREWRIGDKEILILDEAEGDAKAAEAFFHFHPEVEIRKTGEGQFQVESLTITFEGFQAIEIETYHYCQGFNKKTKATRLRIHFKNFLTTTLTKNTK